MEKKQNKYIFMFLIIFKQKKMRGNQVEENNEKCGRTE